jgi:hypothetical protein
VTEDNSDAALSAVVVRPTPYLMGSNIEESRFPGRRVLPVLDGGIALLGTVTATLASWLVEAVAAEKEQAEDLQITVRRLEDKIDRLANREGMIK